MALSDLSLNGDKTYEYCEQEVQGKNDQRLQINGSRNKIVLEDSSSYHCSFGMYTEEMKFAKEGEKGEGVIVFGHKSRKKVTAKMWRKTGWGKPIAPKTQLVMTAMVG